MSIIPKHLEQYEWYSPHLARLGYDVAFEPRRAYLRGANLSSADLRDADLRGANLRGAYLRGANLSSADLRDAYLLDADLRDADLRDANLRGAYLRGANLSSADLRDADLRGAYLSSANLRGANLRYANLRYADLSSANLRGADLLDADLRGAKYNLLCILQISFGDVAPELCTELMRWDAAAHPNPGAFQAWANGGDCPLNTSNIQRAFLFDEKRELYEAGAPTLTLWELWVALAEDQGITI